MRNKENGDEGATMPVRRERAFIIYPFLVAAYGVLALAAKNAAEVSLADLGRPLVIALAIAVVGLLWGLLLTRDRHASGLIALALVLWFAGYSYVVRFLAHEPWLQPLSTPEYAVPLIAGLFSAIAYSVASRFARHLSTMTRFLNRCALILSLIPAVMLLNGWRQLREQPGDRSGESASMPAVLPRNAVESLPRPDIYLIILDEYTGARSLRQNYGFDNRSFEDSLAGLGFFVPASPHSNYVHTHLALASILNWQLLQDRPASLRADQGALKIDYTAIEDNRTARYLHDLGYRFVFFPSNYRATARNRHADLQLPDPAHLTSEFETAWFRATPAMTVRRWWCDALGCDPASSYEAPPAELIEWKFDQLGRLSAGTGPTFTFAHLVTPHWPYMFDAECHHVEPYRPPTDSGPNELPMKRAYVAQIQCVNHMVLGLVGKLIAGSKTPPIIILQADHGHGRLGRSFPALGDAGPERVAERTDIFAAYYLPGHPTGVVYDSITPVNVLPRIFNHYFDARIPLQPDATFWSTWDEPFKFTRIR